MGFCRRALFAILAGVAVCAVAATAAPARSSNDAADVASRFLTALVLGDGKGACSLMTSTAVGRLEGIERCERAMGSFAAFSEQDYQAFRSLDRAYEAAQENARTRGGKYVTKRFGARALARAIERAEPTLTVKLGRGPQAARGQLEQTIILDQRSTARRLVLYSESDDGSIWRLSAPASGEPDFDEVAQGIPESAPPDPSTLFSIGSIMSLEQGQMLVRAQLKLFAFVDAAIHVALVLTPSSGSYLVDDMLFSMVGGVEVG
jgi:hypothetical protein